MQDTDNAPASAVFASIARVAEEVNAVAIVMARHNKVRGRDPPSRATHHRACAPRAWRCAGKPPPPSHSVAPTQLAAP